MANGRFDLIIQRCSWRQEGCLPVFPGGVSIFPFAVELGFYGLDLLAELGGRGTTNKVHPNSATNGRSFRTALGKIDVSVVIKGFQPQDKTTNIKKASKADTRRQAKFYNVCCSKISKSAGIGAYPRIID